MRKDGAGEYSKEQLEELCFRSDTAGHLARLLLESQEDTHKSEDREQLLKERVNDLLWVARAVAKPNECEYCDNGTFECKKGCEGDLCKLAAALQQNISKQDKKELDVEWMARHMIPLLILEPMCN